MKGCPVGQAKTILEKLQGQYANDWAPDFQYYLDGRTWADSPRGQGVYRDSFHQMYPFLAPSFQGSRMTQIRADLELWRKADAKFGGLMTQATGIYQERKSYADIEWALDSEEWYAWRDAAKTLAAKEHASGQLVTEFEKAFELAFASSGNYLDSISSALAAISANVAGVQASVLQAAVQNPTDTDAVQVLVNETLSALGVAELELEDDIGSNQFGASLSSTPPSELQSKPLPLVAAALMLGVFLLR